MRGSVFKIIAWTVFMAAVFWVGSAAMEYFDMAPLSVLVKVLATACLVVVAIAIYFTLTVSGRMIDLALSADESRTIFDASNDAIFIHDIDSGAILNVNRKVCDMFGYDPDEMIGMSVESISSGKQPYAKENAKRWMKKAATEGPQIMEWMAKDKKGRLFWVEVFLRVAVLDGKKRLLAIVRDVTKHKAVEKAYEESEKKYKVVFRSSPVAIGIIDKVGRLVEMNGRLLDWLGFDERDIVGKKIWETPFLSIDGQGRTRESFKKRIQGESLPPYELDVLTKDGSSVSCEIHADLIYNEDGEVIGYVIMIVNISARKEVERALVESEKKYRAIFETSPEAIVVLDTRGYVLDVNGRILDNLGFTPEEVRGRHLLRVPMLTMASRIKGLKTLLKRIRGQEIPPYELEFVKKTGEKRWGLIRAKELRNEKGDVTGDLVLITDVTDRRRAEERIEKLNETMLSLSPDFDENVKMITETCGELMDASCAMYNRLEDGQICSVGQWMAPSDYKYADSHEGYLCYDVIKGENRGVRIVRDLPKTSYYSTDPNVAKYELKTYIGCPVHVGSEAIGSLCVAYQRDLEPSDSDVRILEILAATLGIEETRRLVDGKLKDANSSFRSR